MDEVFEEGDRDFRTDNDCIRREIQHVLDQATVVGFGVANHDVINRR